MVTVSRKEVLAGFLAMNSAYQKFEKVLLEIPNVGGRIQLVKEEWAKVNGS